MPPYPLSRRKKSALAAAGRLLPLALAASLIAAPLPPSADAGSRSFTDMAGHWAAPLVAKALEDGLAGGYGDGTFRPDKPVSEAEYLALLLRAYGDAAPRREPSESWKASYYDRAFERGWPLTFHDEAAGFRRGQAARLTAVAANGTPMNEDEAIEWLLRTGIAKGRSSGSGAEGFAPNGFLTRAEALAMIYRLKAALPELSTAAVQLPDTALHGISLRDHVDKLLYLLGEPSRIDKSEYDYDWYVYSRDYGRFAMFGVSKRRIVALYSADPDSWTSRDRLRLGTPLAEARRSLNADKLKQTKAEYATYELNGDRTTLFLDTMEQNKLAAMLVQDTAAAKKSRSHSPELRSALERQLFDLTNAERAARGIAPFEWDAKAAAAARKHSEDMRDRSYFNHQSPGGSTPFDRMEAQGIEYRSASENIAAGFADSMLAHYALLNSEEHRKSILSTKLERMGTGVALGGKYKYYYTQDFYTPF